MTIQISHDDKTEYLCSSGSAKWCVGTFHGTFDGVVDDVWRIGYNCNVSGQQYDVSLHSWYLQLESDYKNGTKRFAELNLDYIGPGQTMSRRIFSSVYDRIGDKGYTAAFGSFNVQSTDGYTEQFVCAEGQIVKVTGDFGVWDGTNYRMLVDSDYAVSFKGTTYFSSLAGPQNVKIYDAGGISVARGIIDHWVNNQDWLVQMKQGGGAYVGIAYVDSSNRVVIGSKPGGGCQSATAIDCTAPFKPLRVTSQQRSNISNPEEGMIVYDTDLDRLCVYNSQIPAWRKIVDEAV